MNKKANKPVTVLTLAGLDPQGSAGIAADILSIANNSGFALPIVTNITAQNTKQVFASSPVSSDTLIHQIQAIHDDTAIDIIKIGLMTDENISAIEYIAGNIDAKIVLDPIIKSSTLTNFNNLKTIQKILPHVFLLTPNAGELTLLTCEENQELAVKKLDLPWMLITQTDNSEEVITHRLFQKGTLVKEFTYKKLTGDYHGSGCVLSSAIAANIPNRDVISACEAALDYTYQSLINPLKIGKMQYTPNQIQDANYP